jgi:hypothetical protein
MGGERWEAGVVKCSSASAASDSDIGMCSAAAYPVLPIPSYGRVTNVANGTVAYESFLRLPPLASRLPALNELERKKGSRARTR